MKSVKFVYVLPVLALAVSCAVEKSENPLSPTIAGPIAGVQISAPKPLEPAAGAVIPGDKQPVTLLLENAASNGPRPLTYNFEIATDAGFTNKVFAREGIAPGADGRTALKLPDALSMGRSYYWRAMAQDGANTGPYSAPVNFDLYTPVAFDKPVPVSPINDQKTETQRPEFRFRNAPRVGSPGPVTYVIEVATNASFANKLVAWQFPEQANETKFPAASDLPPGLQLFWHTRAFEATALGPWSDTAVFRTPAPIVVAPPTPTPGPGPGGACTGSQPINVIECRRKSFPAHMSDAELTAFVRAAAKDLNSAGISGGPFGILKKPNGFSCGGYSCDIVCTGQGSSQKQWDILGDADGAQTPAWIGPKVYPDIRTDTCEIQ